MKKLKLKPPKVKRFKANTPIIFCPDPLDYVMVTQYEWERRLKERERDFYGDLWGRILATLRGETYAND